MNIWLITQYYVPEIGAPSTRLSGLVRCWQAQGLNVTVLTGIPNHPEGVVPAAYQGKPAFFTETLEGTEVRRHWLYATPNKGRVGRVLNLLSFAFTVWWHNRTLRTATKPEIVVASSPNFFCAVSGWLLAKRHGAKFVFEVRDLWPAIFVQMNILKPGLALTLLERLEMFLYKKADAIVTVTRSFAHNIMERGIPKEKLGVVFNGVSDADYAAATLPRQSGATTQLRAKLGLSPLTKIVLYIGNHGEAQALTQVIDAARLLGRRTDTLFLLVGGGAEKQKLIDYAKGVPNIQFLPSVGHAEVWAYYQMADINLVCLKNIPDFAMFIPSKMFEIMAAESCAVAALQGEGAELMRESGAALVVPSENAERMAEAIGTLLDDPTRRGQMAQAGRAYVAKHFLHSSLAAQYVGLFQKLLGR
jgi:glycosyltransferase involved in cell wall biosynthesis